jgi:hypothetical protein
LVAAQSEPGVVARMVRPGSTMGSSRSRVVLRSRTLRSRTPGVVVRDAGSGLTAVVLGLASPRLVARGGELADKPTWGSGDLLTRCG